LFRAVVLKLGGVKSRREGSNIWQGHIVGKQDNGELTVVLLFVFDLEIRWGTSNNGQR